MTPLTAIWTFIKKHWQVILLVIVIAVGYFWVKRQQANFADTLKQMNDSNQVMLDEVNAARERERQEHAEQVKRLEESLVKINVDYAKAQEALAAKQTKQAQEIVKKYGNDADGLANLLADRMGFGVVKPASQ